MAAQLGSNNRRRCIPVVPCLIHLSTVSRAFQSTAADKLMGLDGIGRPRQLSGGQDESVIFLTSIPRHGLLLEGLSLAGFVTHEGSMYIIAGFRAGWSIYLETSSPLSSCTYPCGVQSQVGMCQCMNGGYYEYHSPGIHLEGKGSPPKGRAPGGSTRKRAQYWNEGEEMIIFKSSSADLVDGSRILRSSFHVLGISG